MRVDLPSGAWVEVAEEFRGSIIRKVKGAVTIPMVPGGVSREAAGVLAARMADAFLREAVTAWSLEARGVPVPSRNAGGAGVIRAQLGDADYAHLHAAVGDLVAKVARLGGPGQAVAR
jgi:hypothetical protein